MASGDFSDLASLWGYVTDSIKDIARNELVERMKDVEQEVIQEVVLDAYSPTYYLRRSEESDGSEGLISRDNMTPNYIATKNSIYIEMTNDTKGNTDYPYGTNDYIDEIIEFGKGYTWTGSDIYQSQQARPFTEVTNDIINNSNIVEQTIKDNVYFEIK